MQWGNLEGGTYNLKEANLYIEQRQLEEKMQGHQNVWDTILWRKIKTFLWTLLHRKTLTWENLCEKGFHGPSYCPLYLNAEETMNHLLNSCCWTDNIWMGLQEIFRQKDRDKASIQNTIVNWRTNFSKCDTVNNFWKLCLGFIVWSTWKE